MVVRKILESTLVAGASSVTFTDTDIPNSLLRVYCTKSALFPISQTLSGNTVTVNYKPQDSNVGVALEIVKSGLDIVDDLVTEDNSKALSANQGYVLKGLIDDIVIPTVPENITDLDDVEVTDITNNQVLAWDADNEKFVNVDQSGGGSASWDYSTDEKIIGKWIDGSNVYKRSFVTTQAYNNVVSNSWCAINEINSSNIKYVIDASWLQIDTSFTPVVSVNYPILASTNRNSFSNKLAVIQTRGNTTSFPAGSIITIIYTKITD